MFGGFRQAPVNRNVLALRRIGRMHLLDLRRTEAVNRMGGRRMRCVQTKEHAVSMTPIASDAEET